jgi:saccharopine dehydrogenase-like NADP-dependent oxidoreductase
MKAKEIVVLGGYGGAGNCISRLLLEETDASIVIAGRRKEMADELARDLNSKYPERASSAFADASDPESLAAVFENADLVVVASTTTDHVQSVAQAAIDAGIDYLDIHYPQQVVPALNPLASQIERAGLRFITQAGFCPGLPSTLVRLAAFHLEDINRAIVGVAMNTRFEKGGALYELLDSFADFRGEVFERRWHPAGLRDTATIDFGHLFGRRQCYR